MNNAVSKLKEYMQKFRQYETIENLLYWDLSTMTPEKGVESKADAIGYFSTEAFRLSTSDEYGALLKELSTPEQFEQLDDALKVTVQRELRNYERLSVYRKISTQNMSHVRPALESVGSCKEGRRLLPLRASSGQNHFYDQAVCPLYGTGAAAL